MRIYTKEIPGKVIPDSRTVVLDDGTVRSVTDVIYDMVADLRVEQPDNAQSRSGLANARNERGADGDISEYVDGAPEFMTQQAQPATKELTAPQLGSQLRQKGAE